jgi:hypothetical protein
MRVSVAGRTIARVFQGHKAVNLKHAMVRAIVGQVVAEPGCPQKLKLAWEAYQGFWKDGHWHHPRKNPSILWEGLLEEIREYKPEIYKILCTETVQINERNRDSDTGVAREKNF